MATNEILPFASTNTGTNLLTQEEYSADGQRNIGHQPGIARSKLENKVLRQASLMAAGLAEFIADYQDNNVTDGLTTQNIADYLYTAILMIVPDATTSIKGKAQLATNLETQVGNDANKIVTPSALSSLTATDARRGLIKVATAIEVGALTDATSAITPLRLPDAFPISVGSNAMWAKLPNGLIIQTGNQIATNPSTLSFPIAFPNRVLGLAFAAPAESVYVPRNYYQMAYNNLSRFGFSWGGLRSDGTINGGEFMTIDYIAIGF